MNGTAERDERARPFADATGEETLRCVACDRLWPRTLMRWGTRPAGPVWFPRTVRVLRCPDCLPA
jgi:hypothetical protein